MFWRCLSILFIALLLASATSEAQQSTLNQPPVALEQRGGESAEVALKRFKVQYPTISKRALVDSLNAKAAVTLQNDPQLGFDLAMIAEREAFTINYKYGQAESYNNMGIIYRYFGLRSRSLKHLSRASELLGSLQATPLYSRVLVNMGALYTDLGYYKKAQKFYTKALSLQGDIAHQLEESIAYHAMGNLFQQQEMYDSAYFYYQQSLNLAIKNDYLLQKRICLNTMSQVLRAQQQPEKALLMAREAYNISIQIDSKLGKAFATKELAACLFALEQYPESIRLATSCLGLNQSINRQEGVVEALTLLAQAYAAQARYDIAWDFIQRKQQVLDLLNNEERVKQFKEEENLQQLDSKEKENAQLRQLNESTTTFAWVVGAMLVCLLLLSIFLVNLYLAKSRSNNKLKLLHKEVLLKNNEVLEQAEELRMLNQQVTLMNENLEQRVEEQTAELKRARNELDMFLYRSAHDLRRPISTLRGLIEIARLSTKEPAAIEIFNQVALTTNHMQRLLEQLSMISYIYHKKRPSFYMVEPTAVFDQIFTNVEKWEPNARSKVNLTVDKSLLLPGHITYLTYLLQPIVENALQFAKASDPEVKINCTYKSDVVFLTISDNGSGIDPQDVEEVFKMFSIRSVRSKGIGLGLFISKKAAEVLEAVIEIDSEPGYTSVSVKLYPEQLINNKHTRTRIPIPLVQ